MYCVIGQKVLRCEVSEKLENFSWVRIGKTEKGQTIPNNRIFETEDAARQFIEKRDTLKSAKDKDLLNEIAACKSAYDAFFKETGISVRIIDRLFKINEVEKQIAHLRKKYNKSQEANETGAKTPKDSRQFSTKPSSSFRDKKDSDENNESGYPYKNKNKNKKTSTPHTQFKNKGKRSK